jgi:hypothetical protein
MVFGRACRTEKRNTRSNACQRLVSIHKLGHDFKDLP